MGISLVIEGLTFICLKISTKLVKFLVLCVVKYLLFEMEDYAYWCSFQLYIVYSRIKAF